MIRDSLWCLLPGNLHFVNVVPEDSKYGATYACVAENKVTIGIQRGEFNTIATYEGTSPAVAGYCCRL